MPDIHLTARRMFMKNKKSLLISVLETIAVMIGSFLICFWDVFSGFDTMLTDNLYQDDRGINNKIKIVGIDDHTIREMGQMGSWSRQVYADIIESLDDYADIIVFDLMIFGEMDEAGDTALKEACRNSPVPVIAGVNINFNTVYHHSDTGVIYIDNYNIETVDKPIMNDECITGFVNAFPDRDGIIRSAMLTYPYEDEILESLSYKAYREYCARKGIKENTPKLDDGKMLLSYAGRPGDYEKISLCDVINGNIDPKIFSGCVVFVGAYASGLYDQYAVPANSDIMFGTEIHANIFQALYDNKFPLKADKLLVSAVSAIAAGLLFFLFRRTSLRVSVPPAVIMGALYVAAAVFLYSKALIVPILYFPLFDLIVVFLGVVHYYFSAYTEKKKITEAFRKYVAPQVVDEISGKGGYSIRLGGESREIAVLFVDIRGFTPMSENLEPEQVVDILNSYLELTTNSIFNNGGTLDKFIGDATMAVFNAPFDLDDYIFRACKTALDIVAGGDAIESKFLEKYGRSVGFGVGVNCGKAVVGNIGCSFRMDYTAIGDTVNTAARLEANAKKGQVLISEDVYEHVKNRVTVKPVGAIPLKGKSKDVFVYSLTGLKEKDNDQSEQTGSTNP